MACPRQTQQPQLVWYAEITMSDPVAKGMAQQMARIQAAMLEMCRLPPDVLNGAGTAMTSTSLMLSKVRDEMLKR